MRNPLTAFSDQLHQLWPPTPKWSVDDIPDLTGKVAIVTGGNSGLGRLTAKYLAKHGCTVYVAAYSAEKGEETVAELQVETENNSIHFLQLDLADLESVRQTVAEFERKEGRLDMLFNNASVEGEPKELLTKQGLDLTFGYDFVGHAYFTQLLLPLLLASARSAPSGKVRVINVSSNAHAWAPVGGVDWENISPRSTANWHRRATHWSMHCQTKWAIVSFTQELHRRYGSQGIVASAVNPGDTWTGKQHAPHVMHWARRHLRHCDTDPYGVLTQLWAGTAPEAADLGGEFLWPWARVGHARADTGDEKLGKQLWEFVEMQGAGSL